MNFSGNSEELRPRKFKRVRRDECSLIQTRVRILAQCKRYSRTYLLLRHTCGQYICSPVVSLDNHYWLMALL